MASTGEDVVLSIEETNKLRASLGLKPLSLEAPQQREQRAPPPAEAKPDAEAIRAKLTEAREKRRREQELQQTRGLGEAGDDADDVGSWVLKQRQTSKRPRSDEPNGSGAAATGKRGRRRSGDGSGEEDGAGGLAGARVRHGADELAEGETLVLTLADAPILGADGGLNDAADELEEVARAQDKARAKARRAAGKEAKPLWAEDGRVRSLLDKYDEEEEEAALVLDEAGRAAASAARQDEVRQRLEAAKSALDAVAAPAMGGAADYMTAEEAAAAAGGGDGLKKKKKKREKKLRTTKVAVEEDEETGGGLDLDAMEAAAKAEGGADHGSRASRQRRAAEREAATAAEVAERSARFARALEKANWASEALRVPAGPAVDVDDEAEAELAESLSRARRLAQKNTAGDGGGGVSGPASAPESVEGIAARLAKKRAEDEARLKEQLDGAGSDLFNAATEFVRNIGGGPEEEEEEEEDGEEKRPPPQAEASYMDLDGGEKGGQQQQDEQDGEDGQQQQAGGGGGRAGRSYRKKGGWVSAEEAGEGEDQQQDADRRQRQQGGTEASTSTSVAGDRPVGRGLAGALGLLQDTGALKAVRNEWAGRTNEKKAVALIGLEDVYTGGTQEDRLARSIEAALTQRDEFGRVMTPKERFRNLCHQFHGIFPSKNKEAHRQRKYLEEVAVKRSTSSADPSAELDKLRALTEQLGTPYLPLDGKAALPKRGGDDDDGPPLPVSRAPKGGGRAAAGGVTPQLGGGLTPLVGDRKVEAMLGIKKPAGGMPPPKPKGGGNQ